MKKKQILITGHQGFIGSHVYKFLKEKYIIIGCDSKSGDDIFNIDNLDNITTVIHLAALTNVRESFNIPEEYMRTNVLGTAHMVRLCMDANVKMIYLSSAAVEDPNSSPYAFSKATAEKIVLYFSTLTNSIILRPYNIYGSHSPKDSLFYNFLTKPQLTIYGDGTDSRDLMKVIDLCEIIKCAIDEDWHCDDPIPVGTGISHSILTIARLFQKYTKKKIVWGKSIGGIHRSKANTILLRKFYKKPFVTDVEKDIKELIK